jgi:dephospho-CoA kinase
MIILGLTGSIGMGKSTAAKMLYLLGVPVHSSDSAIHRALEPRGEAFETIARTFPECWNSKTHTINRAILGDIVFKDAEKKQKLERILHPIAQVSQQRFVADMRRMGKKIVCLDIPLLFETGAETRVDCVICVTAPYDIQKRRVLSRPNMTMDKFLAILNAQMPDIQKQALSDYVVPTGRGYAVTFQGLRKILQDIRKKHYA